MKTEFSRKAIYTKVCWVLKSDINDINTGLVTMKGILVIMVIELLML